MTLTLTPVSATALTVSAATAGETVWDALQALRRRQLVPVASRCAPSYSLVAGELSDPDLVLGGTARLQHTALQSCHGIVLAFGNFYNHDNSGTGTETNGPNDIVVAAAVEAVGTRVFPVSFNGARQVTIKPGAIAFSDPMGVTISKGTEFFTRTYVSVGAGESFPRGSDSTVFADGEGHNYASPVGADLTAVGSVAVTADGSERVYGPYAILGYPKTPGAASIAIFGDSIAAGSSDSDLGYIVRALGGDYPYQRLAFPGETVDALMQQSGTTRFRRASLMEAAGITHIICEIGVNSLGSAVVETNIQTLWSFLAGYGVPVYQTTITPKTTSTDSWATVENQTVGANEAARLSLNELIRSTPSPLTGYFEIADLAESARDSGKWNAGYTDDGTHPNATGSAALAAGIDPGDIFGGAST